MSRLLVMVTDPFRRGPLEDRLPAVLHDWQVTVVGTVEDAMDELDARSYDVVAGDARVPGLDDPVLLRHARQAHPEAARVALTDTASEADGLRLSQVAHRCVDGVVGVEEFAAVVRDTRRVADVLSAPVVRRLVAGTVNLASPPETYVRLRQEMADPDCRADDVARLIEADPALSAKVLQLVNSSFFGRAHRATRVTDAVAYLGLRPLSGIVTTLAIAAFYDDSPLSASGIVQTFQAHGVAVSTAVTHLLAGRPDAADGATAGLLHDVGKLVLADHDVGLWNDTVRLVQATGRPSFRVEQERYGTTHAEVGAALLELWGLPSGIVEAVADHHRPARGGGSFGLAGAVHVGDALVHQVTTPTGRDAAEDLLDRDYLASAGVLDRVERWSDGLSRRLEARRPTDPAATSVGG